MLVLAAARPAHPSTYVVFLPFDSPVYDEMDTLNSLGYLNDYLDEIKPISRIEAARLTLEAQQHLVDAPHTDAIAREIVHDLREQFREEIRWIRTNNENNPPTAMLTPIDRVELQYIYSDGPQRFWRGNGNVGNYLKADEGTPLLPNDDGIPTATGSNEVARWSAWGGFGGFLSAYGEAAIAGPMGRNLQDTNRVRPLGAEAVMSLGNWALSFGEEEMWWGPGHFSTISQSDNADPIPGFRLQNVHPFLLPGFFSYLGQFRLQVFFGRLDAGRLQTRPCATCALATFARPWFDGEILTFRTLPNFEWGITHALMFGGQGNNNYSVLGFLGRATGANTGSTATGNTNAQAGLFLKFRFPRLRDSMLWVQTNAEDNFTNELRPIGGLLPILSISYQGGYYLPRLTRDGRTDLRFEWKILEPNYQTHSDSLYWSYNDRVMDDPLGPNASEIDFQIGRWFSQLTKASGDVFFTDRAPKASTNTFLPPQYYGPAATLHHERSAGFAFDMLTIPQVAQLHSDVLAFGRTHLSFEYCDHMNFAPPGAFRAVASFSVGIKPNWDALSWTK
ncbi:MAG TPA: capsule assembly Wzi family protein [Candidatus Binataceae bacterium]|nr:capsule assembly Wzi family protein [Candidatus Binataceae bacterium]